MADGDLEKAEEFLGKAGGTKANLDAALGTLYTQKGDYEAAKTLVEQYAIDVDADLHTELLERYRSLGIAPYKGFINPHMTLITDTEGTPTDVVVDYSEKYDEQMMRYSREYTSNS